MKSIPNNFLRDQKYLIVGFNENSNLSLRFCEMGCVPGAVLKYIGQAPWSGPLLFSLDAQTVAIRSDEASLLNLSLQQSDKE
jgi:Fe2+ transport system protein FeoA